MLFLTQIPLPCQFFEFHLIHRRIFQRSAHIQRMVRVSVMFVYKLKSPDFFFIGHLDGVSESDHAFVSGCDPGFRLFDLIEDIGFDADSRIFIQQPHLLSCLRSVEVDNPVPSFTSIPKDTGTTYGYS